jgi:hypothetical protein
MLDFQAIYQNQIMFRTSFRPFFSDKRGQKKILVLAIDIDDTLIHHCSTIKNNTSTYKLSFNGSARLWQNYLKSYNRICSQYGYHLVIQIISAKASGNVDTTVDMVCESLKEFLNSTDKSGLPVPNRNPNTYDVMFHVDGFLLKKNKEIRRDLIKETMSIHKLDQSIHSTFHTNICDYPDTNAPDILPPVHICQRNMDSMTSKAYVLKHIQDHLEIPPEQVIMLDNCRGVEQDITSGARGRTPRYQFVSAHDLEWARSFHSHSRARYCEYVLQNLEKTMLRLLKILHQRLQPRQEVSSTNNFYRNSRSNGRRAELAHNMVYHNSDTINRHLEAIRFNHYLTIFKQKAARKAARQKWFGTDGPQAVACLAFYHRLDAAKNTYINSNTPLITATTEFIKECKAAIELADEVLASNSSRMNCGRFFCGLNYDRSYRTNRDRLAAAVEKLQVGVFCFPDNNGQRNSMWGISIES